MAGTVLAAAIVMTVGAAAVGIGALSGAAVTAQAVTGAADNAALAMLLEHNCEAANCSNGRKGRP